MKTGFRFFGSIFLSIIVIALGMVGCKNPGGSNHWTENHVVTFNPNGGNWSGSTDPITETVVWNTTVSAPTTDPARSGFTFAGWYTAATGGSLFNFSDPITATTTLYARWRYFAGGTGTAGDPYQIADSAQFALLAEVINSNTADTANGENFNSSAKYYKLTADIYLNTGTAGYATWGTTPPANSWTPIGDNHTNANSSRFTANFIGDGKKVYGIYINSSDSYNGLFGYVTGVIENTGIEQSYIKSTGNYTGGLAGYIYGSSISRINNCYNSGIVSGAGYTGGVAGYVNSTNVTNCYNTGSVTGAGNTGGVAGYVSSTNVTNCYNTGSVTGTGNNIGGMAGFVTTGTTYMTNCYNTGNVSGVSYVGGIAGMAINSCKITNCYNRGTVTGTTYVGGVAGEVQNNSTSLYYCYWLSGTAVQAMGAGNQSLTTVVSFNSGGTLSSSVTIGGTQTTLLGALNGWVANHTVTAPTGVTYKTWTGTPYPTLSP